VPYKLHSVASVGGSCLYHVPNDFCTPAYTEARTIGYTQFYEGVPSIGSIAAGRPFSYDSHVSGETSGPVQWQTSTLGTHTITSQTAATQTGCGFLASFPPQQPITVNVVKCGPAWRTDANGNLRRFAWGTPEVPQMNYVYVPASLRGTGLDTALIDMIPLLNTALTGAGVPQRYERTIDFNSCTSPANIAHCIQMTVDAVALPGACGQIETPAGPNGIINDVSTLTFPTGWTAFTEAARKRVISHELMHPLGIRENDCGYQDSLMTEMDCYGENFSAYTIPTINELLAIAKTAYGGGTRQVCY
jgi:hypothetical protein